jgi:hypothetical protein
VHCELLPVCPSSQHISHGQASQNTRGRLIYHESHVRHESQLVQVSHILELPITNSEEPTYSSQIRTHVDQLWQTRCYRGWTRQGEQTFSTYEPEIDPLQVALQLAQLLTPTHVVTSIIRDPQQSIAIESIGAKPSVLSLEEDSVAKFAELFEGQDVVYFCAGSGGKGGVERTRMVDYEGALKVCHWYSYSENECSRIKHRYSMRWIE